MSQTNQKKTMYTGREIREIWRQSEEFKWTSENKDAYQRLSYPFIARFIPTWEKKFLDKKELSELQLFVRTFTYKRRVEATARIFNKTGMIKAGDVASKLEQLKSLNDEEINRWLMGMTDEMYQSIIDGTIPPIMVIKPVGLDFGNLPDGNHRVLAALKLAEENEDIKLPAFVGVLGKTPWAIHNKVFKTFGSNAMSKNELGMLLEKRGIGSTQKGFDSSTYSTAIKEA